MNVSVIGGGPGGAFAAFLLKKARPDWEVTVYERSPPAVTYGWGIVLPEKLYTTLRKVDRPTCKRIKERNTQWDPIDTIHRGEHIRCGGHPYTSILRTDLLEILQDRCEEVGVDMRFETEIQQIDAVVEEADLVIGADGIHSQTREQFAERFGTVLEDGENLFSWFGTDQQFDALTHIYEENEHGLWHGAAYPGPTSTFVITCEPETWRDAGIDEMSEDEYTAYLEGVFADHLDNYALLSTNDKWRPFTTVSNDTWYHENVVLLGDAAHTAHFTIGSGTRMAIEDAIGLAGALDEYGRDIEAALEQYEANRKSHVDILLEAADRSQIHFEHLERYARLDPLPFAALYLTRTGHNTYDSLREEDPSFIAAIDRWFASTARNGASSETDPGSPLEQPFTIGDVTIPNRLVTVPELGSGGDGRFPTEQERLLLQEDERVGMVTVPIFISANDDARSGLCTDEHVKQWSEMLDQFKRKRSGTVVGARLVHEGAVDEPTDGLHDEKVDDRIRIGFSEAADRAARAGFDAVEIDLARSFSSERFCTSPEDTVADTSRETSLSIVDSVRDAWPDNKPLSATLAVADSGEHDHEEAYGNARDLADCGCDALSIVPPDDGSSSPFTVVEHSKRIRNEVEVPTIAGGPQLSSEAVNTALASGRADLCVVDPAEFEDGD